MTKLLTRRQALAHTVLLLALSSVAPRGLAQAPAKTLLNLDAKGLALQGYDPVAFHTVKAPVKGKPEFFTLRQGARYLFHSAKNKALFDAHPERYEPAFGGYCAYGVSRGRLVEIDVEAFQVVGDRLLLQYSKGVRDDFNRDTSGNLSKADQQWPVLVEKKGR